ncbi:hypothetical protein SpCBS45565_g07812 [Spizellomyces sp. 'palustris']|nr:hypothetical protein SpCBS45565_g07812 [Spizellomyces sp. 'palustris']
MPQSLSTALNPTTSTTLTTPLAKHAAQNEAQRQDVQIVDAHTTPDQIAQAAENVPVPIILAEAEQPVAGVFQNVVNFRDVGRGFNEDSGKSYMKIGNLFRSGRLDDATTRDLELLTAKYGIKTVVDLRSETEGKMGEDLVNTFPASAINEQTNIAELIKVGDGAVVTAKAEPMHVHSDGDMRGEDVQRVTYYINFAGRKFRRHSVWKPLRLGTKLKVIALMAMNQKPRVIELVGQSVIEPRGLLGLNKDFVDYCGAEIVQALRLLSNPAHYPLLVHCTQGKDRTGLVIALALRCAKIPEKYIIKDYARTQQGLARQRDVMVEEMRKTGLDPSFCDAPPDVIKQTLEYIRTKYGSEEAYLEKWGFGSAEQQKVMACLVRQDVEDLEGLDGGL